VRLYDVHGRLVRTLADDRAASAGEHFIHVDGRSDAGTPLASGVYFYRIEAAGAPKEGRLTVLK
jgi:flagellar hook assembly protein FlgD